MTQTEQLPRTGETSANTDVRLAEWLRALGTGEPRPFGSLEVTPLSAAVVGARSWLLLHEAVAKGAIEVREIGGGGAVNEVQAFNSGEVPVLVVEGESIVGAKQNRVVVETVLVAPRTLVSIPVGCVEHGRWHARTAQFAVGAMPVSPALRRSTSREAAEANRVDQQHLWSEVAICMAAERMSSQTGDYAQLIEARQREYDEQARALQPVEGQVGMVAVDRGALVGLEVVGHPDAWRALSSRLLSSYLLWRAPARGTGDPPRGPQHVAGKTAPGHARGWLEAVAAGSVRLKPARGLGVGVVLVGDGFTGAGLWHEDRPMHLAVFGTEK